MPNSIANPEIENVKVTIDKVVKILKTNFPRTNITKVYEAYKFAEQAHHNQYRKSGELYIVHPLFVAYLCASIKLDDASIIAALLHDTVEDTSVSLDEIKKEYGEDTAFLVDGLTKIENVTKKVHTNQENFESLRKLLIASTKDVRVILIKLADRLHNMMTISVKSPDRQVAIAEETLSFYAPLADFVGINFFRKKLEDYSFRAINKDKFDLIQRFLDNNKVKYDDTIISREEFLVKHVAHFQKLMADSKIKATVFGRNKGIYSIYRKVTKDNREFQIDNVNNVNDLIGITILVNSISECYKVLGIIHATHDHIPHLYDDYVAKPKDNGYRSIHTCLINKDNIKTGLQIKTFKMNEYNEFGPASHIYYKQKEKDKGSNPIVNQFAFLKSLVRWKDEIQNIEDYKVDVFRDKIFVFTPAGNVKELPKGSTIVDFAYMVHTNIGNSCGGGKVNGVLKPLNFVIDTGDVVEIMIDKKRTKPGHDWLSFVVNPYTKTCIRKALRETDEVTDDDDQQEVLEEELIHTVEKLEAPTQEELRKERTLISETVAEAGLVRVKDIDNIDCYIAKCCSPIPGDDIIGHVTKSRGIRIHRKGCKELESMQYKILLEAEWRNTTKEFSAGLIIKSSSDDAALLITEISKCIASLKIKLDKMDSTIDNGFQCRMFITISTKQQLEKLMKNLKKLPKVTTVERINLH